MSTPSTYYNNNNNQSHNITTMDETIMDPFFAQMHPQNWISPAAISWDGWGFLSEKQYELHQPQGG